MIPARLRREMLDKHITRLVKGDDGSARVRDDRPRSTTSSSSPRAPARSTSARSSASTPTGSRRSGATRSWRSPPASTRCATPASRSCCATRPTTKGTQLPDRWSLPDALRDDTGVIFASAFPGLEEMADEVTRHTDGPDAPRAARRARVAARADARPRGHGPDRARRGRAAHPRRRAASSRSEPYDVRPPLPLPRALDGPLAARRADRRARAEHAGQLRVREHDAGRRARRGLDPRRAAAGGS